MCSCKDQPGFIPGRETKEPAESCPCCVSPWRPLLHRSTNAQCLRLLHRGAARGVPTFGLSWEHLPPKLISCNGGTTLFPKTARLDELLRACQNHGFVRRPDALLAAGLQSASTCCPTNVHPSSTNIRNIRFQGKPDQQRNYISTKVLEAAAWQTEITTA